MFSVSARTLQELSTAPLTAWLIAQGRGGSTGVFCGDSRTSSFIGKLPGGPRGSSSGVRRSSYAWDRDGAFSPGGIHCPGSPEKGGIFEEGTVGRDWANLVISRAQRTMVLQLLSRTADCITWELVATVFSALWGTVVSAFHR